jgi:[FeFe] hydrogenase H-cluster maturation GTPase HydF
MAFTTTPAAGRLHIGFFGRRNAGKSSLLNAVTAQEAALVSGIKGTTTDPVYKAMELLPLGPVMIIDTPGVDDDGPLGELRVRKTREVLGKTDVAVLVVDASCGPGPEDEELIRLFKAKKVNYLIAKNKCDLLPEGGAARGAAADEIFVSAKNKTNIEALKEKIAELAVTEEPKLKIVGDLIGPSDFVVLVTPIDKAAPKGRLILPQQQTIRDILEADAAAIVVKEFELRETLASLNKKPRLVITDSQAFAKVSADTPPDIPLTSFSILFARCKGDLRLAAAGAKTLDSIRGEDKILICEGCTHHRQCDDIGTVKLPRWIRNYTNQNPDFAFTSGSEFPADLSPFRLVIHCGACMLGAREMKYRLSRALDQRVPITNYGVAIAFMQGILRRGVAMFPHVLAELD